MTTEPRVPLRMEVTFELPGTPDQLWDAIATSNGITAWFMPTDVDEHDGGAVVLHMGDSVSEGTITGWEPPRRFAYVEPDWAAFSGHPGAPVTPLATEFLIEARSGGTCVLRVVSSAFGVGADWEQEFFDEMEKGWLPFFDNLRLYLTRFAGQSVTPLSVVAEVPGSAEKVWPALRGALGAEHVGQTIEVRGVTAKVERISPDDQSKELLLSVTEPVPGYLGLFAFDKGDGSVNATLQGYLFSPEAAAYVEREQSGWHGWLQELASTPG